MESLVVQQENPLSETAGQLIAALTDEINTRFHYDGTAAFRPEDVLVPGSAFVVAWLGETPVGCGALRPLGPGIAEVKRMYVAPEARRRGVARAILAKLETIARDTGYHALRLETGTLQQEAIALYERNGYRSIPCYGDYAGDPDSICFEKHLE